SSAFTANGAAAKQNLRDCAAILARQIKAAPDAVNTFLLAETLNFPGSGFCSPALAAVLYRYSAGENYIPSMLRLAEMLFCGNTLKHDPILAEKLLQKVAAGKNPQYAGQAWLLSAALHKNPAEGKAGKHLELAQRSGATKDIVAIKAIFASESSPQKKVEALHRFCIKNPGSAALALSLIYLQKPIPHIAMAINSALLAEKYPRSREKAAALLLELDKQYPYAFIMTALWNNALETGGDLAWAQLESDTIFMQLLQHDFTAAERTLQKCWQQDAVKVCCNGILLLLMEEVSTRTILENILQKNSGNTLQILLTKTLLASHLQERTGQLHYAQQLFELIRNQPSEPAGFDLSKIIDSAVPGAMGIKPPHGLESYQAAWNISIIMQLDALLANGEKIRAEKLLKQHKLLELSGPMKSFQRNFVKKFAPHILAR
ncbi:MAG: hypothetical protein J6S19_03935, partial [Lentisphaeria bacterium]|nr:hypothetical protein [Lentisphaeria bacterium]